MNEKKTMNALRVFAPAQGDADIASGATES
jgi:hypothetical protein